ncbi:YbaB/EbfC family nucleoid-associated protein [Amycolatopsis sp. NPDC059021]|uniref:YbaB/EbfC family nucleoid-associated protein n=1 Tax=Amycolatopsis sp. NPDC059021 TaxID=3346704 RepID=UPI0036705CFF
MMHTRLQDQLNQAIAELTEQQKAIDECQRHLTGQSTSVLSKDRMLSATVDVQGGLSKLEFHDTRYRSMAPAELADAITKVVAEARREMLGQVTSALRPHLQGLADLSTSTTGSHEWDTFLEPLRKMMPAPMFGEDRR